MILLSSTNGDDILLFRHGIEHAEIAHRVTGKLVLGIEEDASLDPFLSVVVELDAREKLDEMSQDEVTALETEIARLLRMGIERENSEFAHYVPEDKRTPKVVVKPFGEETYFKQGVKHKWIQGQ
jgi:phenylacetate-CoA ligase